jgi:uroporphyrinogen-III synthase
MAFDGLRVTSFESRRATGIAELIRRQGGEPLVAPSMREAPLEDNHEAFEFAARLFAGEFDMMVLLTGVGTRALHNVLAARYGPERFLESLRKLTVVVRGPKPTAVLRELKVPITVTVPEPNTWRELLAATAGRPERHIAVQEYGKSNADLLDGLRARGAEVTAVRVYQWALPEDAGPLREATRRLAQGEADVVMFTTSIQVQHLFQVAAEEGIESGVREALGRVVIASVGPTTTETLEEFGIRPDFEPSHPKMGFLVKETSEQAHAILTRKRGV